MHDNASRDCDAYGSDPAEIPCSFSLLDQESSEEGYVENSRHLSLLKARALSTPGRDRWRSLRHAPRLDISGDSRLRFASQARRLSRRLVRLLMLNVATFTRFLSAATSRNLGTKPLPVGVPCPAPSPQIVDFPPESYSASRFGGCSRANV